VTKGFLNQSDAKQGSALVADQPLGRALPSQFADKAPTDSMHSDSQDPPQVVAEQPPDTLSLRNSGSGSERLLDAETWEGAPAVESAARQSLPKEALNEAARRLGLIAAGAVVLLLATMAMFRLAMPGSGAALRDWWPAVGGLLGTATVLSLALAGVARLRRLRSEYILDLGYAYLFLLCFLLGLLRHWQPWPPGEAFRQWSLVTVPIFVFGALIPATPRKALAIALSAALMDPLAYYIMRGRSGTGAGRETLVLLATPVVGALLAYAASRLVHRLSEGIAKAREVGSYRLTERLGVGGMAEVWRAEHRMLARPAAVKLIRPEVLREHGPSDAARLIRLFAREARATAALESPHTIQLYDFGITREGAFYYVMELLDGIDLQSLVERFGPQPAARVASLLAQACRSLSEAHARSFVHRDVKPANLFTCRVATEYDFVKVLDFGLVLDRHPTAEELEDKERFVGTPAVMAPEMVRFHAPVDARADIYALGCVGYWLLTGHRVFDATTRQDMLVMHAHQKPQTPSKCVGRQLHEGLEALVMDCLAKNPNRRPQSAAELGDALESLSFETPWTRERARAWWVDNLVTSPGHVS
jgi:plasmid stabilization system protein ParE